MSRHRRRPARRSWYWFVGGAGCLLAAVALVLQIVAYTETSAAAAHSLLNRERAREARHASVNALPARCSANPPSSDAAGLVRAVISAPTLGMVAPVLEGTAEEQLRSGVGHITTSSWPDQGGTVVLAAHDVTFFSRIDHLRVGDRLIVTAPCREWTYTVVTGRVTRAGTPVPNDAQPTLVLVTCYPTTALFYTNQRYVVTARLLAAGTAGRTLPATSRPSGPGIHAALPAGVDPRRLTPTAASAPMGTLHADAAFSSAWLQSDQQLDAAEAATQLFLEGLNLLRHGDAHGWATVAPSFPIPSTNPLLATRPVYVAPVSITLHGTDNTVTSATVVTALSAARHGWTTTVNITVTGGVATIASWTMAAH